MKLFLACLGTETNTFSPFVTGYRTFEETYVARGGNHGATPNMFALPLVRWRELAVAKNWEVVESLCAFATPAGLTLRHVYEDYRDEILADLQAAMPVDAVLLSLHGAMVADGYEDCEGDLIAAVRRIVGPDVPIGGELDLHCHLTELMVEAATVLVAYKEYPHTDYLARADELFALIAATLAGEVKPRMALYDCAMIGVFHTSRQPMRQFVDDMIALESQDAVLSVSLGHGFPWGDVAEMGTRVLVVTDDQPALAASLAADLGRQIFDLRVATQPDYKSMAEAIEIVRAGEERSHRPGRRRRQCGRRRTQRLHVFVACIARRQSQRHRRRRHLGSRHGHVGHGSGRGRTPAHAHRRQSGTHVRSASGSDSDGNKDRGGCDPNVWSAARHQRVAHGRLGCSAHG